MRINQLATGAAVLAIFCSSAAFAKGPVRNSGGASIPFGNHGGIQAWRALDDHTLYLQGRAGQWYVAKTMGPCFGLNSAIKVGFDTGSTDTFDQFSSLIVRGQHCPIKSFGKVSGPPPSSKPHTMKHQA